MSLPSPILWLALCWAGIFSSTLWSASSTPPTPPSGQASLPAVVPTPGRIPGPTHLSLAQAIATGIAEDTFAMGMADDRVVIARAKRREARSALLPSINGAASLYRRTANLASFGFSLPLPPGTVLSDQIGPYDVVDARLEIDQAIFDAGAMARFRAEGMSVAVSVARRDAARETQSATVALAFLGLERAEAVAEARKVDLALARRLTILTRNQTQAGVGRPLDLSRARSFQAGAEGRLIIARNIAQQDRIVLARVLGMDPTSGIVTDRVDLSPPTSPATEVIASAVTMARACRPDLRAARLATNTAQERLDAIGEERWPRVSVEGDYGRNGVAVGNTISTWDIGARLTVPIIDGFSRAARADEDDAHVRIARRREVDLSDQVEADVESALIRLATGRQQAVVAAAQVRFVDQEIAQATERYHAGIADATEVIDAEVDRVQAYDARIEARSTIARACVDLAFAVGVANRLTEDGPPIVDTSPPDRPGKAPGKRPSDTDPQPSRATHE